MTELKQLQIGDFVGFVDVAPRIDPEPRADDAKVHWAVCQTFSNRVHRVRPEIEKSNHGTFLPTYARLWSKHGKPWSNERPLMPGYLFFLTTPDGWGDVVSIDGVHGVITNGGLASKVAADEMRTLVLDHAMGVHNRFEVGGLVNPAKRRYGNRRRRPRPGKRLRAAA